MKRFLLATTLSTATAACSGGGGAPTPTPAPATTVAATATPAGTAAAGGAPTVTKIRFEPAFTWERPTATDTIKAIAETTDPDGDGVLVQWKWFLNGSELVGETADTLRPGRYKKGDKIEAEALPRDTKGTVGTSRREFLLVRNSVPSLGSRPTGSLNGYKPILQDADAGNPNERHTWSLEAPVPPGFSISPDGTLKFDAAAGKGAAGQKVTILVTDSAGATARQTFDVQF